MIDKNSGDCSGSSYVSIMAIMLLGMILIWESVPLLNGTFFSIDIDITMYEISLAALSVFALVFTWHAFKKRRVLKGMLVLLGASSSLYYTLSNFMTKTPEYYIIDAAMGLGLLIIAYLFLHNRNYILGVTTFMHSVVLVAGYFLIKDTDFDVIVGICSLICGLLYCYYSIGRTIAFETGEDMFRTIPKDPRPNVWYIYDDYPKQLSVTAMMFTFGLTILVICLSRFYSLNDGDLYFMMPFYVATLVLSSITIIFSAIVLTKGIVIEGMLMAAVSIGSSVSSVMLLLGVTSPWILGLFMSFVPLVTALCFLKKKERMMAIASALLFVCAVLDFLCIGSVADPIVYLATAVIIMYVSASKWISLETGKGFPIV